MAYIGMNSPSASSSTGTTTKTFIMGSDIAVGDHIYTSFSLSNSAGNYKVGRITLSTNWNSNIRARYRDDDDTGDGVYQTISDERSFSFYTNWLTPMVWLYFDFLEPGPGGSFEVSITWEAVTNHLATYSTDTPYTYTGTSITGIYNLSGCTVGGGTNTATNVGSYAVTLTANNASKHSNAYYFASSATGVASTYKDVTWKINKATQNWTLRPSSITMLPSNTAQIAIDGNWSGNISAIIVDTTKATIDSINQGSGVITIISKAVTGSTIISVSTAGNSNIEPRTYTATITIGSGDKCIRIYHNGAWGKYVPYIYHNGSWQKAVAYVYTNNQWKEVDS